MVLTYAAYATGAFHISWATGSAAVATAAFFVLHVPLLWPVYGTGRVGDYEYFVLYPLVAAAAALLGFLFGARMNMCAPVTWPWRPRADCAHQAQWARLAKHVVFVAALVVLPALPLELYVSNTFVGGLVSLLVALLVHVCYWAVARLDAATHGEAVARRTAAVWCALIDIAVLRLGYTLVHMLWADFRFTEWPLYVELAAVAVGLVLALPLLECCYLRRADDECAGAVVVDECAPPPCPPRWVAPAPPPCPPRWAPPLCAPTTLGGPGHHGHGHGHNHGQVTHGMVLVVDAPSVFGGEFNNGMTREELNAVPLKV